MAVIKRPGNKYFLLNYIGVIVCLLVKENVTEKSLSVLDLLVELWWPIFIQLIIGLNKPSAQNSTFFWNYSHLIHDNNNHIIIELVLLLQSQNKFEWT